MHIHEYVHLVRLLQNFIAHLLWRKSKTIWWSCGFKVYKERNENNLKDTIRIPYVAKIKEN